MLYEKEHLKEISFPLGGIGSGSIGLAGNGQLIDWEIFNNPSKGSLNGYSHFAVRAKRKDGSVTARVLQGDLQKDFMGQYGSISPSVYGFGPSPSGYGFGPSSMTMCGFPHFRECSFLGEFPIATLSFSEPDFPAKASLTAFNPFIPLDDENSSLPAAFFEVTLKNISDEEIEYTTAFSVANPFLSSTNIAGDGCCRLLCDGVDSSELGYGDLTVATDEKHCFVQPYWYRGGWQDGIATFWHEFSSPTGLRRRSYETPGKGDVSTLSVSAVLAPNEEKTFRFVLAWNIPNRCNDWNPLKDENGRDICWKNYYATLFENSAATARYALENWDNLKERTMRFKNALFSSTLDPAIIDAASATLSVLKTPTVLRLNDGSFYGWEGLNQLYGSCEGTCSHVWNYAYALCFLFPKLERSIRDLEFKYSTYPSGEMDFRLKLPLGREKEKFRACADGQLGSVIKTYREWKLSGDDEWLKENWQTVQKILEYTWSPANADQWDSEKTGVLWGRQHHTLDMELFGPSSWLEGFYLAALKAGAEMALYLGYKDKHDEYMELFKKGCEWTKTHLFNGSYFIQQLDLTDFSAVKHFGCEDTYWNSEAEEIKYQIGEGCSIDQLCGQWHANICGLGELFDKEQVKTALSSLYRNNFKRNLRSFANPWRIFSLNDESGAIICDYPEGARKPVIPIPYCEETMHGFEYQLAGLFISEGMVDEGLELVRSVRDRYDGKKRNPWNEIECGSNYARSMASFALLPIFSGFKFDLPNGELGFNPIEFKKTKKFSCLWAAGSGWGQVDINEKQVILNIYGGKLELKRLQIPFAKAVTAVTADGRKLDFGFKDGRVEFEACTIKEKIEIVTD